MLDLIFHKTPWSKSRLELHSSAGRNLLYYGMKWSSCLTKAEKKWSIPAVQRVFGRLINQHENAK
jgi:hypothetical protein